MSRTVKIPDNLRPWECEINGVKYGPYPAGSIQTVPDEVGAVIDAYNSSLPVENPPETLEEEITRIATQIAEEKVAEATTPLMVDLTGLTTADFNEWIDVTETCGITPQEFIDALYTRRNIVFKLQNEDAIVYLDANNQSMDAKNATATSMLAADSSGISEISVTAGIQEEDGVNSLEVFASIGFAPNPYAGGGE